VVNCEKLSKETGEAVAARIYG